jgi:homoserine kinase
MTTFVSGPVTVSVPATSANLGPGYDAFGLALDRRDVVTVEVLDAPPLEITVEGMGQGQVPLDERHLVYRSMRTTLERMGARVPGMRMHCVNAVPHARGLGSSSAAIVAGVSLARAVVAGGSLLMDDDAVLDLAAGIEGHPDNVAPALLGGFTIAFHDGTSFRASAVAVDPRIQVVAFVPPEGVLTSVARGLLPDVVPHADAAANAGRAALLVAALGRQPELLLPATEDRLHQDYREPAMPDSLALVRRLRAEGLAAVVSGAGPTVVVLADTSQADRWHGDDVASWVPDGWDLLRLGIDLDGARVERP